MGSTIKRVALDFDWPLEKTWEGYLRACANYCCNCPQCERIEPPAGEGWQVWETVTDGSPITPVFPTAEALIEHLCTKGTTADQYRLARGWQRSLPSRQEAESFVRVGWAPSAVVVSGHTAAKRPKVKVRKVVSDPYQIGEIFDRGFFVPDEDS